MALSKPLFLKGSTFGRDRFQVHQGTKKLRKPSRNRTSRLPYLVSPHPFSTTSKTAVDVNFGGHPPKPAIPKNPPPKAERFTSSLSVSGAFVAGSCSGRVFGVGRCFLVLWVGAGDVPGWKIGSVVSKWGIT